MTRARGSVAAAIGIALALGGVSGCAKQLGPVENLAPETYVFIQGPVDTVNHRVHMHWYGTDPDGEVVAYAFRWVYPPPAPQDVAWDTVLCAVTPRCTDSLFTMFTGDATLVNPRFEVFAIDDAGRPDPTPAAQSFLLSNAAPTVRIDSPLGLTDTTYASVTVSWQTTDPDGGGPGLHYRIWLDGNEAVYDSTSEQTFTVRSDRFLQDGTYRSGRRTLFVQAVDDGGSSGPPTSMTWHVRAPAAVLEDNRGRLLVLDEVPSTGANNYLFDGFYKSIADLLPAGTYDVLRPQFNPRMFRSEADFAQTLQQFQAVLWYRGGETTVSSLLWAYQGSIGAYLDAGGKIYLDGLYLIEGLRTPGALPEEFVPRHLGSTALLNCFARIGNGPADSTAGWSFDEDRRFRSSVYGESFSALVGPFMMTNATGGVRGFAVTDTSLVALWAMDGQLDPPNTGYEVPVGVTVPQPGGGRIVLLSFPVRFAAPAVATRLMRRMLYDFGIGIPLP